MTATLRPFMAAAALFSSVLALAQELKPASRDVLVFERPGNQWFEGPLTPVSISQDGSWALLGRGLGNWHLYSLPAGRKDDTALSGNLGSLDYATFCGPGSPGLARRGTRGTQRGWFLQGRQIMFSDPPARPVLVCSLDGSEIAYDDAAAPDRGLYVGLRDTYRHIRVSGTPIALTFSPDGGMLYCLAIESGGESSFSRIRVRTGEMQTISTRLDATGLGGPDIALSPDGKSAYLSLASDGPPNNESRHKPDADRWLKIYQMDLATGAKRRIVDSPGLDNTGPAIANGNLYWTRTVVHDSIVTVPLGGGDVKELVSGGELPMWNPAGTKIGYFFGGWRLADWSLNLDAAVVGADAAGNRTSAPAVIVSGYHEDFPPAWSPDGKWIAFHSHRSPTPVPDYYSPGSTDDIYLRRADDLHAPEIRLTDFGWEAASAYWSPDGHKLLFASYERGGPEGIGKVWVITVDTQKGAAIKSEKLPVPADIRSVWSAMWSPDGKEIAIEDDRGAGKRILWIVRADGSHPQKLIEYGGTTYGGLDWTRDGKAIVYSGLAGDRLQLFSIARSGGAPRQLTHDSGNLMHPLISPDGRLIACTRIVQSKQIWRRPLS